MNFGSRHNAVSDFYVREVERVLENLNLVVYLLVVFRVVDARLDKIVEVNFSKGLGGFLLVYLCSRHQKENLRNSGGYFRNWVENYVAYESRNGKQRKHSVRVYLEQSLWQKFACKKDYNRRDNRLNHHKCSLVVVEPQIQIVSEKDCDDLRHQDTVDYERDVIAHE